jgi:homoserine kinase type II
MESVFVLWYVHKYDDPERDDEELLIGVYRTEDSANTAIGRLSNNKGCADRPEEFEISRYELDKDHWTDGFIVD